MWASVMARALAMAGVTKGDMVHNAYGYGLFTGGLGAHYGVEALGATVIPVSGGNTKRQITIMRDFGSTVLLSTPSYALNLADAMADVGVIPDELKLRVGIHGAEPWSENMREEVERKLGIKAVDIYGLSRLLDPEWPWSVLRANKACIFWKIIFCRRLLIRIPLNLFLMGSPESWSSRR